MYPLPPSAGCAGFQPGELLVHSTKMDNLVERVTIYGRLRWAYPGIRFRSRSRHFARRFSLAIADIFSPASCCFSGNRMLYFDSSH